MIDTKAVRALADGLEEAIAAPFNTELSVAMGRQRANELLVMLNQCADEIDALRHERDTLRELVREANRDGVVHATWFDRAEKVLKND